MSVIKSQDGGKRLHVPKHVLLSDCAPERLARGKVSQCLETTELEALVSAWNQLNDHDPIPLPQSVLKDFSSEDRHMYLWSSLATRLEPLCGDRGESCWANQKELLAALRRSSPAVYDEITQFAFKPPNKKGRYEWLSTNDINQVMSQYERLFPDFCYLGCFSSDHFLQHAFPQERVRQCVHAGMVLNLDPSYKSGSHWVAVYFRRLDTASTLHVEYFDSTGGAPNKWIKQVLKNILRKGDRYTVNRFQHQKLDSECGVYSMFYLLQRIVGRTLADINRQRITDSEMNAFRLVFFRQNSANA